LAKQIQSRARDQEGRLRVVRFTNESAAESHDQIHLRRHGQSVVGHADSQFIHVRRRARLLRKRRDSKDQTVREVVLPFDGLQAAHHTQGLLQH